MTNQTAEPISGVLLLDKPGGMTSHDCVAKIRRLYNTKKVGHTGTLDPMATGLLPILIGRAAKASDFLLTEKKRYSAVLRLGITTDTEDCSGTILTREDQIPEEQTVLTAISAFQGNIQQIPPMYSAIKMNGKKLVDLARRGIEVERPPRNITIYSISAKRTASDCYTMEVDCSKGTYIRTLCADIGKKLGCGGAMEALCRTETGGFSLDRAISFDALEKMTAPQRTALLLPVDTLFLSCPALTLPPFFERLAKNGCEIYLKKLPDDLRTALAAVTEGDYVRLYDRSGFWGLGQIQLFADETASATVCTLPAIRVVRRFVI